MPRCRPLSGGARAAATLKYLGAVEKERFTFQHRLIFDLGPTDSILCLDYARVQQVGFSIQCDSVNCRIDLSPEHLPVLEEAVAALQRKVASARSGGPPARFLTCSSGVDSDTQGNDGIAR